MNQDAAADAEHARVDTEADAGQADGTSATAGDEQREEKRAVNGVASLPREAASQQDQHAADQIKAHAAAGELAAETLQAREAEQASAGGAGKDAKAEE